MRAFNKYTIEATYIVIRYYSLQCICKCLALHSWGSLQGNNKTYNEKPNNINTFMEIIYHNKGFQKCGHEQIRLSLVLLKASLNMVHMQQSISYN